MPDMEDSGTALTRRGRECQVEATEILQALFAADAASDPYPRYADLLATGEVCHPTQWSSVVVFGYAAIESVLRDPVFEVQGDTGLDEIFPAWREHPSMSKNSVIDLNGGEHTRVRGLMSRAFSRRRVESLAPAIAATTASLLDDMADRGSGGEPVDFVAQFAFLLPVIVICDLVGIPQADRETFRPLAEDLVAGLIGERRRAEDAVALADDATVRLNDYFTALAGERRKHPRDDLLSQLVHVHDVGDGRLSDAELHDNLRTLVIAGFLTTTHLLSNGLALLLSDPHLAAAMREAEIAVADFVEETLRYEAPVQMTVRRAAAPAELGGIQAAAGTQILLLIGVGNRDPRRFASPDRFDPRRSDAGALSFGGGPHFCLGAALARMEAAIAFPELLARFPAIASAGEARRVPGPAFRGFESLPVTVA
ncbi:cytochrome P450 [Trebonia kvetii]|uniref:Cytochrome P450 n=1 Tax=Trebonia kvetii TaxID=2480626 RepID=A0A6P2C4Q1_9ACTN|nr:cytochrome P450 [Trebonia kvetii]